MTLTHPRKTMFKSTLKALAMFAVIAVSQASVSAQFKATHADMKITLPEKPASDSIALGDGTMQHRLMVNRPNGSIIIWQQNANSQIKVSDALKKAQNAIVKMAGGEILAQSEEKVDGKPARTFTVSIPEKGGEFRVGYYYANGKNYQVMSVGAPEFTRSKSVDAMFKSIRFQSN